LPLKKKSKEEDDDFDSTTHKGILLMDATACPQDIAYPTDLNILNDAREKSEELIDKLHGLGCYDQKPRTYRKNARRDYLRVAQKKNKTRNIASSARRTAWAQSLNSTSTQPKKPPSTSTWPKKYKINNNWIRSLT